MHIAGWQHLCRKWNVHLCPTRDQNQWLQYWKSARSNACIVISVHIWRLLLILLHSWRYWITDGGPAHAHLKLPAWYGPTWKIPVHKPFGLRYTKAVINQEVETHPTGDCFYIPCHADFNNLLPWSTRYRYDLWFFYLRTLNYSNLIILDISR
jgi:hypothetical protein